MLLCILLTVPPPPTLGSLAFAVNTVPAVLALASNAAIKSVVPCKTISYVNPCTTSCAEITI